LRKAESWYGISSASMLRVGLCVLGSVSEVHIITFWQPEIYRSK